MNHKLLLVKLNKHEFSTTLVSLFQSYLSNRSQYVTFNCFKSNAYAATAGIPQDSNLGPLLFSEIINNLSFLAMCHKLFSQTT